MLETSLPGVLAVGDVRSGNVKHVASAVREGAMAIHFIHRTSPSFGAGRVRGTVLGSELNLI